MDRNRPKPTETKVHKKKVTKTTPKLFPETIVKGARRPITNQSARIIKLWTIV